MLPWLEQQDIKNGLSLPAAMRDELDTVIVLDRARWPVKIPRTGSRAR
jgi:hypothetical protein